MRNSKLLALLAFVSLLATACGTGAEPTATTTDANQADAAATSTTQMSTTSTTVVETTTTAPEALCPDSEPIPAGAVAQGSLTADDGRVVDTYFAGAGVSHMIRVTHPDGSVLVHTANVGGETNVMTPLGYFDVNNDGSPELFVQYGDDRLWIVVEDGCELTVAGSDLIVGAPIDGGGESLLVATLEDNGVSAGVSCAGGMITTHYYYIDPSPSSAGKVTVQFHYLTLEGDVLDGTSDPFVEMSTEEAAEQLVPLDCGDLTLSS